MNERTISILSEDESLAKILFKPVQRRIIDKLKTGANMNENEKRYLRGKLGEKLNALSMLLDHYIGENAKELPFLDGMKNYYITGYKALQHNGFGWFYDIRNVTIFNTRIKGRLSYHGKMYVFIRVRSIRECSIRKDEATGLRYATNEQIYHDSRRLKDDALLRTWGSMCERYGKMFVKEPQRYVLDEKKGSVPHNVSDYGV